MYEFIENVDMNLLRNGVSLMHPFEAVYRAARYCVSGSPAFVPRVGEYSSPLENLYRQHAVNMAAFVPAWNPHSRVLPEAEKLLRNG